jgi:hypothetical protein
VTRLAWLICSASAAATGPACAQAWIGELAARHYIEQQVAQESACMAGMRPDGKRSAEALTPAKAIMIDYWTRVSGGKPSNVSSLFLPNSDAHWVNGARRLSGSGFASLIDPFAAAGWRFDDSPLSLIHAGDGKSSIGQWLVRDERGKRRGTYSAVFGRKASQWRLRSVELIAADVYVDPLVQYCHALNDVLPARLEYVKTMREAAEKRAVKADARAVAAARSADVVTAAAAVATGSYKDRKLTAAKLAREQADTLKATAAAIQIELTERKAAELAVLAEVKAAEEARIAGRAALSAGTR